LAVRFTRGGLQSYNPNPFTTTRKSGGGGGSSSESSVAISEPSVSISGTTVLINGVGYSIPYSSQAEFIRSKTGGVGISSQQAIQRATQFASEQQAIQKQQAIEQARKVQTQNQIKKILARESTLYDVTSTSDIKRARAFQPTDIYQKQTGTFKEVPTYELYSKDVTGKEQRATAEEEKYFRQQTSILQASEKKAPLKIVSFYGETKGKFVQEHPTITSIATNEKLVGVGIPGTKLFASAKDIQGILKQTPTDIFKSPKLSPLPDMSISPKIFEKYGGFGVRVGAEMIPTTPIEVAVAGGTTALGLTSGKVVRAGISGTIGVLGGSSLMNKDLTVEQRTAGGVAGVLGGAGLLFETYPYVKGLKTKTFGRLTGEYKSVKVQPEKFSAIELKEMKIGLIEAGSPARTGATKDVLLPKESPLKRGGFGVKQSEKSLFLGENQILATSQISLFKAGKEIPIEREFFTTPQEPFLKIAETRKSRLGIESPFEQPKLKNIEIGFGFPGQPQIGLIEKAKVGRIETANIWKIGTGSELEAIKSFGTIKDIRKVGATVIEGQKVELFKFEIGKGNKGKGSKDIFAGRTTRGGTRISGETLLSTTLVTGIKQPTTSLLSKSRATTTKPSTRLPSIKSLSLTSPTGKIYSPRITSKLTTKIKPTGRSPSIASLKSPSISYPKTIKEPPQKAYWNLGGSLTSSSKGLFSVSVRRKKKFRSVGAGLTLNEAINLGTGKVSRTLAATFRLTPTKKGLFTGGIRTPQGFYQKNGLTFIQQRKYRLSTGGEKEEIKFAKSMIR
jgi:hypothetical protein